MSTAYHPETNGSSKWTNKTINQCLCFHIDCQQKGWVCALLRIHFVIMNTVNALTEFSNFQLHLGWHLVLFPWWFLQICLQPFIPRALRLKKLSPMSLWMSVKHVTISSLQKHSRPLCKYFPWHWSSVCCQRSCNVIHLSLTERVLEKRWQMSHQNFPSMGWTLHCNKCRPEIIDLHSKYGQSWWHFPHFPCFWAQVTYCKQQGCIP